MFEGAQHPERISGGMNNDINNVCRTRVRTPGRETEEFEVTVGVAS